jgi:hypothetical protein
MERVNRSRRPPSGRAPAAMSRRTGTSYCWGVLTGPRLRQVALVARDCGQVSGELRRAFGWPPPFHDPGIGRFGLTNAVFAVGDTFVEVVTPAQPETTAGRYLTRRGGDGGYMAIFQVRDLAAARRRVARLGVRVVWTADLPDIAATHLHPGDVPGAIVSLDWAAPEQSWRWAGPSWTGRVPGHAPGGVTGLTIEVNDPPAAARRWAAVLGISGPDGGHHNGRAAGLGPAAAVRACPGRSWRGNHRGDHRRTARRRAVGDWRGPLRR